MKVRWKTRRKEKREEWKERWGRRNSGRRDMEKQWNEGNGVPLELNVP
jgi:hypothetical protein